MIPSSPSPSQKKTLDVLSAVVGHSWSTDPAGFQGALQATRQLRLKNQAIADLTPLSDLTALTVLDLSGTKVADFAPLSGLTALTTLDLSETKIADLAPLVSLTALTSLRLYYCRKFKDFSPLTQLPALQSLDVSGTNLKNLSVIADIPRLTRLNLSRLTLSSIQPLVSHPHLRSLHLESVKSAAADVPKMVQLTELTSLMPLPAAALAPLVRLTSLKVPAPADLSVLSGMVALEHLHLLEIDGHDLRPLAGLAGLRTLLLERTGNTGVEVQGRLDPAPLSGLTALERLEIRDGHLTALDFLAPLSGLKTLRLWQHRALTDLSPLAQLSALTTLLLNETGATDLSPLAGLTNLRDVELWRTDAESYQPLLGLPQLKRLHLNRTFYPQPPPELETLRAAGVRVT